ncbi:MAG: M20/M25/M40 family metallo-hydrolase [Gemmatimonadaceae bacterium]|nr:M20/M25/M40 family metallo-hydrolase [Gemmatimonadaceae bacterium]
MPSLSLRHSPVLAALLLPAALAAQTVQLADRDPAVQRAMSALQSQQAWTLAQQISICEIPAPPFKEQARAEEFRKRLTSFGYANARIDAEGNVIAELGAGNGPTVMIAGHLDTVFPEGTDVTTTRTENRVAGPGIGDDCRGLAVVLTLAKAFKEIGIVPKGRVLFVGNVGEEGPGNLRGVRHLLTKEYAGKVDYFISVDGSGGAGITSRAVGSHRYTISFEGPGGHSYGAFGMTNPMHAMGRAIARIADLQVPSGSKTTFNVGIVRGGTSVNTITPMAQMDVDMRSESAENLMEMDRRIRAAVDTAVAEELARWPNSRAPITVKYDTIGIRPTGGQSDEAFIVRTAMAAARLLDDGLAWTPRTGASSTDSNLPISMGIPAITINGGGRGGGAHGTEEFYIETPDSYKGPQFALLIVTALAGISGSTGATP